MKFLLSPDSYKGSLKAKKVAENMELGIRKVCKNPIIIKVPIADGGEGTVDALVNANNGEYHYFTVLDPLNRPVKANIGVFHNNKVGVIEVAEASGLTLLSEKERDPWIANSYGTGELIKHALDLGCREIIVGLGGSATNDGGMGIASALGVKFYDENEQLLYGGAESLGQVYKIDISNMDKRLNESNILIASDVNNPLCGENGASFVFGKQKGANDDSIKKLDKALEHFAQKLAEIQGINVLNTPGSGSAGGAGAMFLSLFNAKMRKGIDIVLEYTNIDSIIREVDFVFTGEGYTDEQTIYGKAPYGLSLIAKQYNKPVICISGGVSKEVEKLHKTMDVIVGAVQSPMSKDDAMTTNVVTNIQYTTSEITRALLI